MHQDYLQGVPVPSCFKKKIIFSVILGGIMRKKKQEKRGVSITEREHSIFLNTPEQQILATMPSNYTFFS